MLLCVIAEATSISSGTNPGVKAASYRSEYKRPVVEHWNEEGYNETAAERNAWYNDPDNLTVKSRIANSSEGVKLNQTYRQDTGPNYQPWHQVNDQTIRSSS